MKYLIIGLLLYLGIDNNLTRIARINELKKQAQEAFLNKDYAQAISHYQFLLDSMQIEDEKVVLNLAHAFYESKDTIQAQSNYLKLVNSSDRPLRSLAFQQLGVMESQKQKFEKALDLFKESIKSNPANEEARYNYELLKKKLQEQQEQQQNQDKNDQDQNQKDKENQKQDQDSKDQQQQEQNQQDKQDQESKDQQQDQESKEDQSDQESEEQQQQDQEEKKQQEDQESQAQEKQQNQQPAEPQKSTAEKLEEINMSEEKAKMILEAMKNNEIQYLQQRQKKSNIKPDSSKPDW